MDIIEVFGEVFWEKITHTKDFIDKIENKLKVIASKKIENKNILLQEIPFDDIFYCKVKTIIDENCLESREIRIKESKEQFLFEDEKSFRNTLLKYDKIFHSKDNKCKTKENFVKFFIKHAFKHDTNNKDFYIWLELYSEKSCDNWVNFISDYMEEINKNKEGYNKNIVFIISYHNGFNIDDKVKSNFECFLLEKYITWYDCYVFFTIISNLKYIELKDSFKLYLAELLTNIITRVNITGKGISLCVDCLKDYNTFIKNPDKKIKNIFSECDVVPKDITEDIKKIIYRSQIRVFYPILNEFRLYFTEKYAEELNNIIKNKVEYLKSLYGIKENNSTNKGKKGKSFKGKFKVKSFQEDRNKILENKIPKKPEDFELKELLSLSSDDVLSYDKDSGDEGDLEIYRDARNELSHICTLKYEELEEIIKIFEKKFDNLL